MKDQSKYTNFGQSITNSLNFGLAREEAHNN